MKKYIEYILVFFFLIMATSCNDFLDYQEEDFYTEEEIFEVIDRVDNALVNLYGKLPDGFSDLSNGSLRASATDDAEDASDLSEIQIMNDGRWSSVRTIDTKWDDMWEGIRSTNRLLENYDLNILEPYRFDDDYDNYLKEYIIIDEQARFLRAFMYFELLRRYGGGIPLLGDEIIELDEVNNIKTNSYEEIKNYIVDECNAIVDNLPVNYDDYSGNQEGRITKGAVMALKARTLLYAVSPLFNSASWEVAAEASWELIDSSITNGWYTLEKKYANVVNNSSSKELILGRRRTENNTFEEYNFPIGYEGATLGGTNPTQNLVNAYQMENGMDITESGSGYNSRYPYINRDPRLDLTIITNDSEWKDRDVESWVGGRDGRPIDGATKTGYYLKKFNVESISLDPDFTSTSTHLFPIFRYGAVLLDYAEAMNEAYGPNDPGNFGMTAAEAVNLIRDRAGMPDFDAGMSQDEFREKLRNERRVELAFEDYRFWDIRRWKIGDQTTDIKGMNVILNDDKSFTYSEYTVETRVWNEKMNLYPFLQDELFINENLIQNEGW